jgi:hypothetical protein
MSSTSKRLRLWLPCVVFCSVIAFLECLSLGVFDGRQYSASKDFHEIKAGMTQAEVEAILGPPQRTLAANSNRGFLKYRKPGEWALCYREDGNHPVEVYIVFSAENRVSSLIAIGPPPSLLEYIHDWLREHLAW